MSDTHSGYEEFLDLVDGPLELDLGTVVRVLHCDQDVEVLVEVLPVGLTPVHLLLKHTKIGEKKGWFVWMHLTNSGLFTAERGERNRISLFFCFGWDLGPPSDSTQTDLHKAQGYLTPFRRRIEIME